jgi:predicted RNA-binding protein YlxR (DUF448 family)
LKKRKIHSIRTCLGCNSKKFKGELLRVVRTKDGVKLDLSGKMSGRGAYFCYNALCFEKGKKRLPSSLKVSLKKEEIDEVEAEFKSLLKRRSSGGENQTL